MTDNLQPLVHASAKARRLVDNPKADQRRYFMLTHGSHLVDTARYLAGELVSVRARCSARFGTFCWFIEADLANGALAHLELTIPVRGDFEEGFRIYGEHGSVQGKLFLPWYHKASVVECFSQKDRQFHRPLGEDAYTYKLQIESFADAILHGQPQRGASIDDGVAALRKPCSSTGNLFQTPPALSSSTGLPVVDWPTAIVMTVGTEFSSSS